MVGIAKADIYINMFGYDRMKPWKLSNIALIGLYNIDVHWYVLMEKLHNIVIYVIKIGVKETMRQSGCLYKELINNQFYLVTYGSMACRWVQCGV